MNLRIVLILILGLGVGFFLHASFVAAQSSFLSSPAFHISELLPQPLVSRDWGFWGNKDAPGLDIVGDIQWRFVPASTLSLTSSLTLGTTASLAVGADDGQRGAPAIIYNSSRGVWMLRNHNDF